MLGWECLGWLCLGVAERISSPSRSSGKEQRKDEFPRLEQPVPVPHTRVFPDSPSRQVHPRIPSFQPWQHQRTPEVPPCASSPGGTISCQGLLKRCVWGLLVMRGEVRISGYLDLWQSSRAQSPGHSPSSRPICTETESFGAGK